MSNLNSSWDDLFCMRWSHPGQHWGLCCRGWIWTPFLPTIILWVLRIQACPSHHAHFQPFCWNKFQQVLLFTMNLAAILAYGLMGGINKIKKEQDKKEEEENGRKDRRTDVEIDRNRFKDRQRREAHRNSSFDPVGQISVYLGNKYKCLQTTGVHYFRENWGCKRKGPSVGQTSTHMTSCFCLLQRTRVTVFFTHFRHISIWLFAFAVISVLTLKQKFTLIIEDTFFERLDREAP